MKVFPPLEWYDYLDDQVSRCVCGLPFPHDSRERALPSIPEEEPSEDPRPQDRRFGSRSEAPSNQEHPLSNAGQGDHTMPTKAGKSEAPQQTTIVEPEVEPEHWPLALELLKVLVAALAARETLIEIEGQVPPVVDVVVQKLDSQLRNFGVNPAEFLPDWYPAAMGTMPLYTRKSSNNPPRNK